MNAELRKISFEEYRKAEGINAGLLCNFQPTPAHFKAKWDAGDKETDSLLIGRLVHAIVLEGAKLESLISVAPEGMKFNVKAGIDWKKEHAPGGNYLTFDEGQRVNGMVKALFGNSEVWNRLKICRTELSVFVDDPVFNVRRKIRVDALPRGSMQSVSGDQLLKTYRPIFDMKKCQSVSDYDFGNDVLTYGYHIRAAFYLDTYNMAFPNDARDEFHLIAVEEKAPHAVRIFEVDFDSIETGRREYKRRLATYLECKKNDAWPAYDAQPRPIRIPEYAIQKAA